MMGSEVMRKQVENEKKLAHNNSKEMLAFQIDRHDVISFDIFDTLLCRKVLVAEDVFNIISERAFKEGIKIQSFRETRVKAQERLGLTNPDIYEIYNSFQQITCITESVKNRLIQLELEVELEVLIPRRDMVEMYQYALRRKKNVYLVSDMYLPKTMMELILKQFGITSYKNAIISCDYKKLKLQGLFQELLFIENEKSVLHIGDHEIYDGLFAKESGIDTFLICTPWELATRSSWGNVLKQKPDNINDRSLLGLSISTMFNSPFRVCEDGELLKIDKAYNLGYILIAPIVTVFMDWFLRQIKDKGYDGILFAARDGYLIQKLYRNAIECLEWYDMPEDIYFQTSRKAAVNSDMQNEAVINMLIGMRGTLSPEKVLEQLFGLDIVDIKPFPEEDDWDLEIYNYVWKHKKQIFQKSLEMRRNYLKYMGSLDLKIGGKYVFYDFVSSGTCQKALSKIVPFELCGLYFGWNGQDNLYDVSKEALFNGGNSFFVRNYKILEVFMTSDKPSLKAIDKLGEPVFADELRSKEEIEMVGAIHQAISDYFAVFVKSLYIPGEEFDVSCADRLLSCIESTDFTKLNYGLYGLELNDDWKSERRLLSEIL